MASIEAAEAAADAAASTAAQVAAVERPPVYRFSIGGERPLPPELPAALGVQPRGWGCALLEKLTLDTKSSVGGGRLCSRWATEAAQFAGDSVRRAFESGLGKHLQSLNQGQLASNGDVPMVLALAGFDVEDNAATMSQAGAARDLSAVDARLSTAAVLANPGLNPPSSLGAGSAPSAEALVPGMCFAFTKGACSKGAICNYRHSGSGFQVQVSDTALANPRLNPPNSLGAGSAEVLVPGMCFAFTKGACSKGATCNYRHGGPGFQGQVSENSSGNRALTVPTPSGNSDRVTDQGPAGARQDALRGEFMLCKQEVMRMASASDQTVLPQTIAGLLKKKRDVNLYIKDNEVCFQFKFNQAVIDAVKAFLPGRRYDAVAKTWKCPLESLPSAIALYEHMGRTVDAELKRRAAEVKSTCGGASSSASIRLLIELQGSGSVAEGSVKVGSCAVSFNYDAEVVAAIKQLPPSLRSYEPAVRLWHIDVLALPELLEVLGPLGYKPSHNLLEICRLLQALSALLFSAPQVATTTTTTTETSAGPSSQGSSEHAGGMPCLPPASDRSRDFDRVLQELVQQVCGQIEGRVNRADVGQAKRRKLTPQQKAFSAGGLDMDFFTDSEDDGLPDAFNNNNSNNNHNNNMLLDYSRFLRSSFPPRTRDSAPPTDCDCGQPWRLLAGRHCCRYYGTFCCVGCGNQWTSAYAWRGERQACRNCEKESLPVKTEPLLARPGANAAGGGHDCSRCSKCRQLGHDCSAL
ncbi:unnamed protein product [Polarella glacialis]|uniref:C3H1-type domain-containing protein n=1 Tax=Polarella glacialis TaxID=89957 RepID=A0A813I992_POLGL|nr:unnamed protein product [Polarella glacialis]